jgi:hypothetical protein
MATYQEIIGFVQRRFGYKISHTCWIADVKARHGLTTRTAPNRQSASQRVVPCHVPRIKWPISKQR